VSKRTPRPPCKTEECYLGTKLDVDVDVAVDREAGSKMEPGNMWNGEVYES